MPNVIGEIERIQQLTTQDLQHKNVWHLLASATEELGELSRELQIEFQIFGNTYKKADEGSVAEAADLAICALAIYFSRGGTLEALPYVMQRKLDKWERGQRHDPTPG